MTDQQDDAVFPVKLSVAKVPCLPADRDLISIEHIEIRSYAAVASSETDGKLLEFPKLPAGVNSVLAPAIRSIL